MITSNITLTKGVARHEILTAGIAQHTDANLVDMYRAFSVNHALFDTGILPLDGSGVLSIRQALGYKQIVFQHAPGVYPVMFSHAEGGEATLRRVAMPNRVVIADFHNEEFLGARHFYTTAPVHGRNALLYHVNLPNLNCKGYSGVGVGWICLYHKESTKDMTIAEKVRYAMERAGGTEVYNDNMTGTDGTLMYRDSGKPHFLWDPEVWEAKTEQEGHGWVLNEDLWIPVLVGGIDKQSEHDPNGTPLTLGMAMDGKYYAYYPRKTKENPLKPFNTLERVDLDDPTAEEIYAVWENAIKRSPDYHKVVNKAPIGVNVHLINQEPPKDVPLFHSAVSNKPIYAKDKWVLTVDGAVLIPEYIKYYGKCATCQKAYHFDTLQVFGEDEEVFCPGCKTIIHCNSCGEAHDDVMNIVENNWCTACTEAVSCHVCDQRIVTAHAAQVKAKDINDMTKNVDYILCKNCVHNFRVCDGCGLMRPMEMLHHMDNGEYLCVGSCAVVDQYTGAIIKANTVANVPGIKMVFADNVNTQI